MMNNNCLNLKEIETPLGKMLACANEIGICFLEFCDDESIEEKIGEISKDFKANIIVQDSDLLNNLEKELKEYFDRKRTTFSVSTVFFGTEFQKIVWETLKKIPYGETWSYAQQASCIGDRKKVRAFANANSKNKIAIIIPCHRVIGSNGSLTGYAGGLWRKQKLLELEKAILF